jgi:molybdopterin synthase catalytic subunit
MANSVCEVLLTKESLEQPASAHSIVDLDSGAVVDFRGVVRSMEEGREIEGIEYEAHKTMAEHQCRVLADRAADKFGLARVLIHHRIGFVRAGECSLLVQVFSQHRAKAFEGSRWIVDELKRCLPIWKHPKFKIDPPSPRLQRDQRGQRVPTSAT